MEETKKVQVLPDDENEQTRIWQDFGWSLVSSQEINNTDSHLESRGDSVYSVTTKENYVNLLFKRDTNMPNYARIRALEDQFDSIPSNVNPNLGKPKAFIVIAIVASVIGIPAFSLKQILVGVFLFLVAAGFIAGFVLKSKKNNELATTIRAKNAEKNAQREAIRLQARALLS